MLFNEAVLEKAKESYKKLKGWGIILSILMIILGIVIFCLPASAAVIAMWLMVAGILFRGISDIVMFCKLPKGARDGWNLASGIIWALIAIFLIIGGLSASVAEKLVAWGTFELVIGFMVGFASIFGGIKTLASTGEMKAMGKSTAGSIVGGILAIIIGLIVLTYPIGSVITLTLFYGLFLIVGGVSLLCRALAF